MGWRHYDPYLGRFIQPDTIVPDPGNSADFDRYAYVRNNPVRYRDPTGHYLESGYENEGGTGNPNAVTYIVGIGSINADPVDQNDPDPFDPGPQEGMPGWVYLMYGLDLVKTIYEQIFDPTIIEPDPNAFVYLHYEVLPDGSTVVSGVTVVNTSNNTVNVAEFYGDSENTNYEYLPCTKCPDVFVYPPEGSSWIAVASPASVEVISTASGDEFLYPEPCSIEVILLLFVPNTKYLWMPLSYTIP